MGSRRTIAAKQNQKEQAIQILSNSWQEKQSFFEYIKQVPSLQDNEYKLSVKKRDDSFIIVAERKDSTLMDDRRVWTYEDLTEEQRKTIMESPKKAAANMLETFSKSLINQKEGAME
jgi:hypothetical protein